MKRMITAIAAAGAVAGAGFLAGCGSSDSGSDTPAKTDFKAGLVTDIGGVNDRSFNFLAKKGLDEAAAKAGFTPEIRESKAETDYVPNVTRLISGGTNGEELTRNGEAIASLNGSDYSFDPWTMEFHWETGGRGYGQAQGRGRS